jgi:hypothetical protein
MRLRTGPDDEGTEWVILFEDDQRFDLTLRIPEQGLACSLCGERADQDDGLEDMDSCPDSGSGWHAFEPVGIPANSVRVQAKDGEVTVVVGYGQSGAALVMELWRGADGILRLKVPHPERSGRNGPLCEVESGVYQILPTD